MKSNDQGVNIFDALPFNCYAYKNQYNKELFMRRLTIDGIHTLHHALHTLHEHSDDVRLALKLYALVLVANGISCYKIATWLGVQARTIERWGKRYKTGGVNALREKNRKGRPQRIENFSTEIQQDLMCHPTSFGYTIPHWSGSLIKTHLQNRYGVNLGIRQCQRLQRRLASHNKISTDTIDATSTLTQPLPKTIEPSHPLHKVKNFSTLRFT